MTSTLSAVPGGSFSYDNDRLTIEHLGCQRQHDSLRGITNTYDFENRMTAHGSVQIVYDGDGNRVSETAGGTTTQFLVDDHNPTGLPQVLDEIVNGSVTRTYAYGPQRISENQLIGGTWTPSFYGYDGHGNVRFLTNTAATVTDTYQFDAFGNQIAGTGTTANNFLYSGEQFDNSTGLYYLRARYYRMPTGRFLTMDPYQGTILDPASLHKYVYTGNNPVNAFDPTGRLVIVEVAFLYLQFDITPVDIIPPIKKKPPFDPLESEALPFVYERLHNFAFAKDIGKCDKEVFTSIAELLGNVESGPSGTSVSDRFLRCLVEAFEEELSPIPFVPLPLHNIPPFP